MKKISILLIALMVISVSLLSGCEEQNGVNHLDSRFFGTWFNESSPTLRTTYFSNGTYEIIPTHVGGTWETRDGTLIYSVSLGLGEPETILESYYSFSNDNSVLTITDVSTGYSGVYTKQIE